jgi:hypothetical protein
MTKGICSLSVIPVRAEPSHKSEQCTQLLFGEAYTVLTSSAEGEWLQIQSAFDAIWGGSVVYNILLYLIVIMKHTWSSSTLSAQRPEIWL